MRDRPRARPLQLIVAALPLAAFPKCYLDDLVVRKTLNVHEWIERAAQELPVEGLEFYWGFVPHDDPAALMDIRARLERHNLAMPMMCYSSDFTKPAAGDREIEIAKQKRAIEVTAFLGGKFCRVLSGQRRPGLSRSRGLQIVIECIMALLPFAESRGIALVLENHYKDGYWDYPEFAQSMDAFLELLDAIPETPWFGVNYDPSNAIIAGHDPLVLLEAVKHRVLTMHASDRYWEGGSLEDLWTLDIDARRGYAPMLKHGVVGRGLNDYDAIFTILAGVGFRGWISIEDGQDPMSGMEDLRLSANFLREKMAEYGLQ